MAYNVPSPNEMVVDSDFIENYPEKDPVTIINPDNLDHDEQVSNLPLATDHEAMKELAMLPLADEPKILEDFEHTWTVENWRRLDKREHGPVFQARGSPWRILLFPHGNNVDQCSIYLEHGYEGDSMPENWSACVQFALVLWNPNDPSLHCHHSAHHRFTKDEGDWGFTRFVEHRKMFNMPWADGSRPLVEDDTANITAYLRFVEDETGVLWHNFINYDSKKETGYVGLKNQGATCYLNSLLQSLYFTNAFRKAVYEIPTEDDESIQSSAYALQRLFYQLQSSDQAVGTNELTKSFGWETRHIFEQQDVQELSRKLMERMEERMKGTKAENVLPEMFCGKIKTYISCINVDYESSRIEDFWDIQLNVSGNKSLLDSFQDYVQVEKMDGENQYYAGDEYKLQDANKGVIFTSFPDVLHLQLKRFEYDIQRDMMMKINDRYEFPEVFDAAPFLNDDSDRSEPWSYQLHGVLVHSGDLNAGHYYAFLKPDKEGWFYKYDDDKVTKATRREVLEENFGGEVPAFSRNPIAQKKGPIIRQNSAYMLVYIRQSRLDKILSPVSQDDIPQHLRQRVEEEQALREARRKEQKEAHLYVTGKVVTEDTFKHFGGTDMCAFDAAPETDPAAPKNYRLRRTMTAEEFTAQVASDIGQDPKNVRLWVMVNRQNKTTRPDTPIMDLRQTIDEIYGRAAGQRDSPLRIWAEVASEAKEDGEALWPSYLSQPNGVVVRNDMILLLLKHFDVAKQTLNGIGHIYISKEKKVEELVPLILAKMGWNNKLGDEDKLLLWEEIKPTMIEPLKPKQSLKAAELQDGDIICFQKAPDGSDDGVVVKREETPEQQQSADIFEDAREYYDFLENKRTVKFHVHPSRGDAEQYPPFELDLNAKISYDMLVERVGAHLDVPPTHLRLWTVAAGTNNPKSAVRRQINPSLRQILNPGANSFTQRGDAFYFEVLEMSLAELETKKTVPVTWLSEGITKEDSYDVLVAKTGTIEDLIQALIKKAKIADEAEGGRIRVYETSANRVYREPPRDQPVFNLSDYTSIYAERVPESELSAEDNDFIQVYHFQNEVNRAHGVPFKLLLVEGEKFVDTKKRLEKRTGFKGKSFEKIKFAIVRRGNYSKPRYLEDDDELWGNVSPEDEYLGLDHADRTRAVKNGTGDLFLR
ncbi:hypothetical protein N3K66_006613 [Trichothecium roseum]|uniref:Uncharacterized protein n=1 Tax=Trichothecium roseum TaxID=47278 RepID=A0ACC0UWH1_9HYPO|nr:hypothetical protein N3K66_006613 [Trichothecium roseum]